jgi:hypothetical protein
MIKSDYLIPFVSNILANLLVNVNASVKGFGNIYWYYG